eukprot:6032195-Prymnesium_polylepis.1
MRWEASWLLDRLRPVGLALVTHGLVVDPYHLKGRSRRALELPLATGAITGGGVSCTQPKHPAQLDL